MLAQDNAGHNTAPSAEQSQPVITQTAQKLTNASADTNGSVTVTAGARYRFTATKTGSFLFGLATTATIGNIRWTCPLYGSIEIQIPLGQTSLHFQTDTNNGIGYLVEIKTAISEDPYA